MPENPNDLVFLGEKQKILAILKEWNFSKEQDESFLRDNINYDEEIFILKLLISNVHDRLVSNAKDRFFGAEYMKKMLASQNIDFNRVNTLYDKNRTNLN
jgi:predicted site-specific integrase-resolvase